MAASVLKKAFRKFPMYYFFVEDYVWLYHSTRKVSKRVDEVSITAALTTEEPQVKSNTGKPEPD